MPLWSQNRWSSMATTAWRTGWGMSSQVTGTVRSKRRNTAISSPLASTTVDGSAVMAGFSSGSLPAGRGP